MPTLLTLSNGLTATMYPLDHKEVSDVFAAVTEAVNRPNYSVYRLVYCYPRKCRVAKVKIEGYTINVV
jgi:hypothetical protein